MKDIYFISPKLGEFVSVSEVPHNHLSSRNYTHNFTQTPQNLYLQFHPFTWNQWQGGHHHAFFRELHLQPCVCKPNCLCRLVGIRARYCRRIVPTSFWKSYYQLLCKGCSSLWPVVSTQPSECPLYPHNTCLCPSAPKRIHTGMHRCTHTLKCVHKRAHTCAHTHPCKNACTHAHIHIHMQAWAQSGFRKLYLLSFLTERIFFLFIWSTSLQWLFIYWQYFKSLVFIFMHHFSNKLVAYFIF